MKRFTIVLFIITFIGCTDSTNKTPSDSKPLLNQHTWQADVILGQAIADDVKVTLTTRNNATLSGKAACNSYSGKLKIDADNITISRLQSTLMACQEPLSSIERLYLKALEKVHSFSIDEQATLYFYDSENTTVITFHKAKDPQQSVTGTVSYQERIALPPSAIIRVSIYDVSLMDIEATLIAETEYSVADTSQVPINFKINYLAKDIDPRRLYNVKAQITDGDKLMFSNTAAYPVITKGNGHSVDIVLQAAGKATPAKAAAKTMTYTCSNSTQIVITFKPPSVTEKPTVSAIVHDKNNDPITILLTREAAASGFIYTNDKYTLRGKGKIAKWTVGRKIPINCTESVDILNAD